MHGIIIACDKNKSFLYQLMDKTIIERLVDVLHSSGIEQVDIIHDDAYVELYSLLKDKVGYIDKLKVEIQTNDDFLIIDSRLACITSSYIKQMLNEFNNSKREMLLLGKIKIIKKDLLDLNSLFEFSDIDNEEELYCVTDRKTLQKAYKILRSRINTYWLEKGIDIEDIDNVLIGEDVIIQDGVVIKSYSKILGKSVIEKGVLIGENCYIYSSILKEKSMCKYSTILNSIIGKNTTVGPYSNIHTNSIIGDNSRIGNYVEIKKSTLGNINKASHLIYIGDTLSGDNVNFGCGSITVNYDGIKKSQTKIGSNVFIGCNTNLIAPLEIEDDSYIAAGSTINKPVTKGSLAISRCKQINKEGYNYLKKIKNKGLK